MLKKKPVRPIIYQYNNWHEDFGFLQLIMEQKFNGVSGIISMYSRQLNDKVLKDEDVLTYFEDLVNSIVDTLSSSYITMLISKYFKDQVQLVKFISETCYVKLVEFGTNQNEKKISELVKNKINKQIIDMK